jgi:hypothetical protein
VAIGLLGDVMLGRMVAEALARQPPGTLWESGCEHWRARWT